MTRSLTSSLLICLLLLAAATHAQHVIPFASQGNVIELAVANMSRAQSSEVAVRMVGVPGWLRVAITEQTLRNIEPGHEALARFAFDVDHSAPVGQEVTISCILSTPDGQTWSKEIRLVVAAPDRFELFQNYPNPFNPKTEISYRTSEPGRVMLKVYNVLGQEVATLVDADQPAGAHRVEWNAVTFASGVYVYRLSVRGIRSNQIDLRRTMVLLK
jgi:hypothetical protein